MNFIRIVLVTILLCVYFVSVLRLGAVTERFKQTSDNAESRMKWSKVATPLMITSFLVFVLLIVIFCSCIWR